MKQVFAFIQQKAQVFPELHVMILLLLTAGRSLSKNSREPDMELCNEPTCVCPGGCSQQTHTDGGLDSHTPSAQRDASGCRCPLCLQSFGDPARFKAALRRWFTDECSQFSLVWWKSKKDNHLSDFKVCFSIEVRCLNVAHTLWFTVVEGEHTDTWSSHTHLFNHSLQAI